jgi:integrase
MQEDVDHVENIERLTSDRLIKMEATEHESAPRIEILEPAAPTLRPIRPDYATNAAIAVSGSFGFGILAVWFVGFVGAPRRELEMHEVQLYSSLQSTTLARFADEPLRLPKDSSIKFLPHAPLPRELEDGEIITLINTSSFAVALACVGLLSGFSASVLIGLTWDVVDLEANEIRLGDSPPRIVSIEEPFATLLLQEHDSSRASSLVLHDQNNAPWGLDGLAHQILCAAYDAALEHPEEITPSALRHTYLVWLFRQGIRAGDVTRIAGNVSHEELAGYLQSFAGGARASITEIDPVHPALRKLLLQRARGI